MLTTKRKSRRTLLFAGATLTMSLAALVVAPSPAEASESAGGGAWCANSCGPMESLCFPLEGSVCAVQSCTDIHGRYNWTHRITCGPAE